MSLYAIGDLHLSLGSEKPMDIFGGGWEGYVQKIAEGFQTITQEDTVVLCGDTSWAMSLEESTQDFKFLSSLPGKKIILKGNHDYWWTTVSKMERYFKSFEFNNFTILHNNCIKLGDIAICGTRGWFYEEEFKDVSEEKIYNREIIRLETSLKAAGKSGASKIYAFLHYPPISDSFECSDISFLFEKYGVELCCYGHLHGYSHKRAFEGNYNGTEYKLVSSDYINFTPLKLI